MAATATRRASAPVAGIDPAGEPVHALVAASRLRAAVAPGAVLTADELDAVHPTFRGLAASPHALAGIASLCGLSATRRGGRWAFAPAADPGPTADEVPWAPPLASLAAARTLRLGDGAPRGSVEAFVVAALSAGALPARDVKALASAAGIGHAAALAAANALLARGALADGSPKPERADAWRRTCTAFLDLVRRSGRVHAPFAARSLGIGSPAEAALVGRYLADRGLVRREGGGYALPG